MPKKRDMDLVATPIAFWGRKFGKVSLAVKRLMDVSDEVDNELERFQPCTAISIAITQHSHELLYGLDNAVAPSAVASFIVFDLIEGDVDEMPRAGVRPGLAYRVGP